MAVAPFPDPVLAAIREAVAERYLVPHDAHLEQRDDPATHNDNEAPDAAPRPPGDDESVEVAVVVVGMEPAHIDRHITVDASRRDLPEDWQQPGTPHGPGSPTHVWAIQKAPNYDTWTWTPDVAEAVQEALHGVLGAQGYRAALALSYAPTDPAVVAGRLVAMKARYHGWHTRAERMEGKGLSYTGGDATPSGEAH